MWQIQAFMTSSLNQGTNCYWSMDWARYPLQDNDYSYYFYVVHPSTLDKFAKQCFVLVSTRPFNT